MSQKFGVEGIGDLAQEQTFVLIFAEPPGTLLRGFFVPGRKGLPVLFILSKFLFGGEGVAILTDEAFVGRAIEYRNLRDLDGLGMAGIIPGDIVLGVREVEGGVPILLVVGDRSRHEVMEVEIRTVGVVCDETYCDRQGQSLHAGVQAITVPKRPRV